MTDQIELLSTRQPYRACEETRQRIARLRDIRPNQVISYYTGYCGDYNFYLKDKGLTQEQINHRRLLSAARDLFIEGKVELIQQRTGYSKMTKVGDVYEYEYMAVGRCELKPYSRLEEDYGSVRIDPWLLSCWGEMQTLPQS